MEKASIFREKSIQRVTSPEQLNDYVRIVTPGVWFTVIAIVVFLAGLFVWATFGHIDSTVTTAGIVENGTITVYIGEDKIDKVDIGDNIKVNDKTFSVSEVERVPVSVGEDFPEYALHVGSLSVGQWVYPVRAKADLADGVYKTEVVIETINPISFIAEKE